jgi:hypothetical protein
VRPGADAGLTNQDNLDSKLGQWANTIAPLRPGVGRAEFGKSKMR